MLFLRPQRFGGSWAFLLVVASAAWGCASEEIPTYGDPARVAGGAGGGGDGGNTGTTTTSTCDVDMGCAVSFKDDIFPMLDTTSKCANTSGCHADGQGDLILLAGDAASYYEGLTTYTLDKDPDVGPYIVPCDPAKSKITCNLQVKDGDNPDPVCGKPMPLVKNNAPTTAQLKAIEDWIMCGAPNN